VAGLHAQTVTDPGTNRAWRETTSLIKTNALPLHLYAKMFV